MRFTHLEAGVNAVKFFPGGDSVASAGNDGIVSGWGLSSEWVWLAGEE